MSILNAETNTGNRMKTVYICTALPEDNIDCHSFTEKCCEFALHNGVHPIAPSLFCCDEFDMTDKHVRKYVEFWMREIMRETDEIWVFGKKAAGEYRKELKRQAGFGKVIRYFGSEDNGEFAINPAAGNEAQNVRKN